MNTQNQPQYGIPCPDCRSRISTTIEELVGGRDVFVCHCCGRALTLMRAQSRGVLSELEKLAKTRQKVAANQKINL